jgi:1A family penicillin-binding protein
VLFPNRDQVEILIKAHRRIFVAAVLVVSVGALSAIGVSLWTLYAAVSGLPDQNAVRAGGTMARATTIVDVKGRHAFTIFQEQRLQVPLARISPNLVRAVIAIEDQRFYKHGGIDVIRVAGAAVNNTLKFRAQQGGSTITQQLARLIFLTPAKTIRRKLQEVVLAMRLERMFTKNEILELYLNKAYFGDGLHGVEAASLGYFGKHASDLDVAEAALIAGLVKAPSTYAPTVAADRAMARRNVVLGAMRDTRDLDEKTFEAALRRPLRLNDTLRREEAYGQYFKEEVRKQLVDWFGWDRVHLEGLKVETTLDLDMQKAADAEVARSLAEIDQRQARLRRSRGTDPLQAALVAIDPGTGEIRAMVGGRDFDGSRFNRAMQSRRQPGSAFKPFIYAAALEQGYTPATLITGLSEPIMTFRGAWLPEDDHTAGDAITMRAALRVSSNRAAVRMLQAIGVPAAVQYAKQLGLGEMPDVPSLALGSGEVTLLSITAAFGAFANEGQLAAPFLIRRVTDGKGEVLYEAEATTQPVVSPATAFLITSMLQDVVNSGTAWNARQIGFRLPAAGKTGTTSDYKDAWFVGYTPHLVTGVWVGYDKPRTIVNGGYAAELAVPLWARFMTTATRNDKGEWFRAPSNIVAVEIDRQSGRRASDACRRAGDGHVAVEYFVAGTEPLEMCPLHRLNVLHAFAGAPQAPIASRPQVIARQETPAPAEPAVAQTAAAPAPTPEKKKRGFWGRVFGRGGDDAKKERK